MKMSMACSSSCRWGLVVRPVSGDGASRGGRGDPAPPDLGGVQLDPDLFLGMELADRCELARQGLVALGADLRGAAPIDQVTGEDVVGHGGQAGRGLGALV